MAGMLVFRSLHAALEAGFTVYDRFEDGYIVRQRTDGGYVMAIVTFRDRPDLAEHPDSSQLDFGAGRRPPEGDP